MLEITREKLMEGALELLSLKGFLDHQSSGDFQKLLYDLMEAGTRFFILDLKQLQSISENGIASFLQLQEQVSQCGGCFALVHLKPEIDMLFSFLGIRAGLHVFSDRKEALEFLEGVLKRSLQPKGGAIPEVEAEDVPVSMEIACQHCGLQMLVRGVGPYMCPSCGYQFQVRAG